MSQEYKTYVRSALGQQILIQFLSAQLTQLG